MQLGNHLSHDKRCMIRGCCWVKGMKNYAFEMRSLLVLRSVHGAFRRMAEVTWGPPDMGQRLGGPGATPTRALKPPVLHTVPLDGDSFIQMVPLHLQGLVVCTSVAACLATFVVGPL
jgi:hypothetical protein